MGKIMASNTSPINQKSPQDNEISKSYKYNQADLDEFCLWLYGIYEETTIESIQAIYLWELGMLIINLFQEYRRQSIDAHAELPMWAAIYTVEVFHER